MSVKRRELVKYREENGFSLLREGKKHSIYTNGERTIPVKRHRMLDRITANQLCKQAGVHPSSEIHGDVFGTRCRGGATGHTGLGKEESGMSPTAPDCFIEAASKRGTQQRGPCPLHGSSSGTSRCFSANLDEQIFHCFKCGRSGNALDLWAQANHLTIYDAAVDLCTRLHIPLPTLPLSTRNREEETVAPQAETCTMNSP